jgi:PAS domain S-box-containing protein
VKSIRTEEPRRRRRQSVKVLGRAEAELAEAVDAAALGFECVDVDGVILSANNSALQLLGYGRDEYVGRRLADFHADSDVVAAMLERLLQNETLRGQPARLRARDGTIKHVLVSANACVRGGRIAYSRWFTQDVTAHRRVEEEAGQARRDAEAANRTKDEFLAMLGHELRNPLAPILTAVQLMRMRGDDSSPRERDIIERQVKHLVRLVDDLLDVSRITRGRVELKKARVETSVVVTKAIEIASPLLEQRRHSVTVDVPVTGLVVSVDHHRMAQVVSNLLTNAAKYTEPGGSVTVAARAEGTEMVLTVRDTGIGIDLELLPRIFDMFFQGGAARAGDHRAHGGLGLGLAIVKSLVALHGGRVEAHSDGPDRGSEFSVRVPLAEPGAPASVRDTGVFTPARRVRSGGKRIIVVDDNADAAQYLAEALASIGHDARPIYDAPSAIEVAATFKPEVAILDIGLPVMDGYELGRRLREIPGLEGLRIMAATGYGRAADREQSMAAGFDEHLVKPVDIARVEEVLQRLFADPAR